MYLFVYGSLKRGRALHHLLAAARFIGIGRTVPRYRLYDCATYPAMVPATPGLSIGGEIFEVDAATLLALDRVEDVPHSYAREAVQLTEPPIAVEAYIYRKSIEGLESCGTDW